MGLVAIHTDWLHPVRLDGLDIVQHQPEGGHVIVFGDYSVRVLIVLAWPFSDSAQLLTRSCISKLWRENSNPRKLTSIRLSNISSIKQIQYFTPEY